jgi:hypothetical protein
MGIAGHPKRNELFRGNSLHDYLTGQLHSAQQEAKRLPDADALAMDEGEWAAYLVEKYGFEPLVLHEDQAELLDRDSRYALRVIVPFTGEPTLLGMDPRGQRAIAMPGYAVGPMAHVDEAERTLSIELSRASQSKPDHLVEQRLKPVREHVEMTRKAIEWLDGQLRDTALRTLAERKEQAQHHSAYVSSSSLPIRRRDDAPRQFSPPPIKRRPRPGRPPRPATASPAPLDPKLADEFYEHILQVIRAGGQAMTRAPKTYADWGEEARRDVLLLLLNTHYEGQAHAEAFNGSGKTDILIRVADLNLFVGECLMWDGPKLLIEKLEQLFGYSTWSDVRLALIAFVDRRDLTNAIQTGKEAIEKHEEFQSWIAGQAETELRARMTWPGDQARQVTLQIFFIHTAE